MNPLHPDGFRPVFQPTRARQRVAVLGLALGLVAGSAAAAPDLPPVCSSDGQRPPTALLERFINADCGDCWSRDATARPGPGAVALDWIVPGTQGEDALLSAAATRDATQRLQTLGLQVPETLSSRVSAAARPRQGHLRVAHGLALGGYVGASIEWRAARPARAPTSAWLALVETLPAGTEGSPVERNLVRNVLTPAWNGQQTLSKKESQRLFESRPMNVPTGARPERLRVIGWVEDAQGRVLAIAQSRCAAPGQRG